MDDTCATQADDRSGFWAWLERHERFLTVATALLFALQLVHLYWLTTHVVLYRLTGVSYFSPTPFWQSLLIVVDYTEIPALLSTSALYIHQLRQRFSWRTVWFLLSLNTQWLHILWITDEFVIDRFAGDVADFPLWLAWVAILIDYLELPVIADTLRSAWRQLRSGLRAH